MDLNQLRLEIDKIDDALVRLFAQRMEVSARIGDYKKEHGLPILVPSREEEKLADVASKTDADMAQYTKVLYSMLFELSRGYQSQRNATRTALFGKISDAIANTPKLLPRNTAVACISGEDPAMVCQKIFGCNPAMSFKTVEGVLSAIEQGMCRYGILPLEGNKRQLYDILTKQGLFILRRYYFREDVQYLCVSKALEIYPGADKCSIRMALSNRPGALYKVLARLYTLGINVSGLESGPISGRNFHAMFYLDLETSVYSDEFVLLMCELDDLCEEFSYLGSYTEVI